MTTNKTIAKLHFITSNHPTLSHAEQAISAYNAGCKWVQLRMKDSTEDIIEQEIAKILPIAILHNAILLINDNTELALKTAAHGVHLGKSDMCPTKAREILGENCIIGATANTFEDIVNLIDKKVDYVGLGPFRFTTTKKNLSPILGHEGYKAIFSELKNKNIEIPIIAIGGIINTDIEELMQTGLHGIALSGAILTNNMIEKNIKYYQQIIH